MKKVQADVHLLRIANTKCLVSFCVASWITLLVSGKGRLVDAYE